ncbi:DUF4209 domain-containing protein [Micromonospora sp. CPCC 206171]
MSFRFQAAAREVEVGDFKRLVLDALAIASSPMLVPDNWLDPFAPVIQTPTHRSAVPSDLTAKQLGVLASLAALVEHAALRARVADIAWTYGDRKDAVLLATAIDAYRESPLEASSWYHGGEESWRRALELGLRRGKAERRRVEEMSEALKARILAASINDSFLTVQISALLLGIRVPNPNDMRSVADHCRSLAGDAAGNGNQRLARALNRQAAAWYKRIADGEAANQCQAAVAEAYAAEAKQRLSGESPSAMVASHFFERAIATLTSLPNKYRTAAGLDIQLAELRKLLEENRLNSLDEMVAFESEGIDLTDYIEGARAAVQGAEPLEALARLGSIHSIVDPERIFVSATERVRGSIARLFSSSTFSHDGRKVASNAGSSPVDEPSGSQVVTDPDAVEPAVWSEVMRELDMRVQIASQGRILPAHAMIVMEHRYTRSNLLEICQECPFVPARQEALWALGLWHGLNGDFASSAFILVPQLEQLVRQGLKRNGVYTLLVDEMGVETEKGLSALLRMPEANDFLGPGLALELRALLCEQQGPNLRNNLAHGLATDAEAWSHSSVYAWWLCLRIVAQSVFHMRAQGVMSEASKDSDSDRRSEQVQEDRTCERPPGGSGEVEDAGTRRAEDGSS